MTTEPNFHIRNMMAPDRAEVSELIYASINHWYQTHAMPPIFRGGPEVTNVFFDVYEALDPGCGIVAAHRETGRLMASCFFHPRPHHVSLGIMNAHPNHFGTGAAKALLNHIIEYARRESLPVRLTQSALNLDSYSLYSRAGFVPHCAYQDMLISVPEAGLSAQHELLPRVRLGGLDDVPQMSELEWDVSKITRERDYQYCLDNADGFWHVAVLPGSKGLDGFLISCSHPAMNMIGPGVARNEEAAAALILYQLDLHRGRSPVVLVPVRSAPLVQRLYQLGARNCELHFCQVLGEFEGFEGINIPSFLPETG